MNSTGAGGKDLSGATLAELRTWRREAMGLAEEADAKAVDAKRESDMYSAAARELETKAYNAAAAVKESEAQGNAEAAAQRRRTAESLRSLAEENYRKADEKGQSAMRYERESYRHRNQAENLEAQIKRRA